VTLDVGSTLVVREFGPVTLEAIVRYAGASGDFNSIHYDEKFAESAGYPAVFAQGMMQAALLGTAVVEWFPGASVRTFGVRFRDQVWLNDTLCCRGTVTAIEPTDGGSVVTIEVGVTATPGERVVLTGAAEIKIPDGSTN